MSTRRLAALSLMAFLAVQVAVPAVALVSERPARFGWQMYANFPDVPSATLLYDDGTEAEIDVAAQFVVLRAETDFAGVLVDHLCTDGVSGVRIEWSDGDREVAACP